MLCDTPEKKKSVADINHKQVQIYYWFTYHFQHEFARGRNLRDFDAVIGILVRQKFILILSCAYALSLYLIENSH